MLHVAVFVCLPLLLCAVCCVSSLRRGNFVKALGVAVGVPTGSKEAALRDQAAATVAGVIANIKDAEVPKIIGELTEHQRSERDRQAAKRTPGQRAAGTRSLHSTIPTMGRLDIDGLLV